MNRQFLNLNNEVITAEHVSSSLIGECFVSEQGIVYADGLIISEEDADDLGFDKDADSDEIKISYAVNEEQVYANC